MESQGPFVRVTIDQLAALIKSLANVDPQDSPLRSVVPAAPSTNAVGVGTVEQILPVNLYRRAIVLQAAGGAVGVWFGQIGNPPANTWAINVGIDPFLLRYEDIGAAITFSIGARGTNAGSTINWQEFVGATRLG